MRSISDFKKGESGQVLVYVTIIVALAALIITPILQFTYAGHQSARVREERTLELYAADAGIEDAMYQIKHADPLDEDDPIVALNYWDNPSYTIEVPQGWNDRDIEATVEKIWIPGEIDDTNIHLDAPTMGYYAEKLPTAGLFTNVEATAASDVFETPPADAWSRGSGWDGNWTHTGSASVSNVASYKGTYHLSLTDSQGRVERETSLSGFFEPRLTFYANAGSFESGDTAECQVSLDGTDWDTVRTWADGNDTAAYELVDINLKDINEDYADASDFWVAFESNAIGGAIAADDFASGGWSGGSGWSGNWVPTGSASVVTTGDPLSAPYHLKLTSTGKAVRIVDLSAAEKPRLRFWAKAGSFGSSDRAYLKVSTNGSTWTTIRTWSSSQGYTYNDIDLSPYQGAGNLWISFEGSMTSAGGTVASDNFESGGWSGGSGWAGSWSPSGDAAVSNASPHGGNYSLRLRYNTGLAQRAANISDYNAPRLQFWARANSFESGDIAYCYVASSGSGPWYEVKRWTASQSYTYWDIALPPEVSGASTVWVRFQSAMNSTGDYLYVDDLNIVDRGRFYVDDISIAEGDHFYVDDVWVGAKVDIYTLEVAYIENIGDVFMDSLAVWLPPGMEYGKVTDSFGIPMIEPSHIVPAFAGGTVVQWDFSPTINLAQPVGAGGLPIVRSLSFIFSGGEEDQGMFVWMEAHKSGGELCLSWDTGYSLYRTTSQASNEIWGTNTKVEAYVGQGELNKRGLATYGNYKAIGNTLLRDLNSDSKRIRETPYTPSYSQITDIPIDAEVKAAWLYWSAFRRDQAVADTQIDFRYPKEYGPETFAVQDMDGNDLYTAYAYTAFSEPMVVLPRELTAILSPKRYCNEDLGQVYAGDGNNTFFTDYKPVLQSPQARVQIGVNLLIEDDDYILNYATGNVTIIDDALFGPVTINYSVTGSQTLVGGTDYVLTLASGQVAVINDCLAGTVTIDYWASHWSHNDPIPVTHAAYDRWGTPLQPIVFDNDGKGWSYACFRDVTDIVKGSGNGNYGVDGVWATSGDEHEYYSHGQSWPEWCYSGWSLIIVYSSPSETAHQFYLYDPIHNALECPFYSGMDRDIPFTLEDFYPPDGLAVGRLTYFVGEGDSIYSGDYIKFKGESESSFTNLIDPPANPDGNVLNGTPTVGVAGVDIDTFSITQNVQDSTKANVKFTTGTDSWNLIYIVLSFKTSVIPKADYAFNVAAITYSYELGTR